MDDDVTVVGYISKTDTENFLAELRENSCNEHDLVEVFGNNICVPLRIEDDFKDYYIDGRGFKENSGNKMRVLFNNSCCADEILSTL